MKPFAYKRPNTQTDAIKLRAALPSAKFIAGGTNLIDLVKDGIEQPDTLVDISRLTLSTVQQTSRGIVLGALGKNTDTANHPLVRQNFPLLTKAILAGASPQIRNMATNGGNLMQRTRCPYFYDFATACNKREPGSGCSAMKGLNKNSAIFGWSENCVATHPSDMCVALAALDASVNVENSKGKKRVIKFNDFHLLPGTTPDKDNSLAADEMILSIEIPKSDFGSKFHYLKVRERTSYAFALVSVAAGLSIKDGKIANAGITLGGVAHKPWRLFEVEKFLKGKPANEETFKAAGEIAVQSAKPLAHNKFKVELAKRSVARALRIANMGGRDNG